MEIRGVAVDEVVLVGHVDHFFEVALEECGPCCSSFPLAYSVGKGGGADRLVHTTGR